MDPSGSGSSLALTPLVLLPVSAPAPGTISRRPEAFVGPGKTLHELYSTLGNTAGRHANRAAHSLGLGPAAVTERIILFFGDGTQREATLSRLREVTSRKLEKDCARLAKYAFPSEASGTQLEAFKSFVALSTRYPGVRRLFLHSVDVERVRPLEDDIASVWNRPNDTCGEHWRFARNFAAACIVDQDVSSLVEDTPPEQLGSVVTPSDGLSIIEKLLVASDCEGKSKFSRPIAIRYLGGILQLPSFWLQSGTIYRGVVQKLLARASILLKDLGVDSPGAHESAAALPLDIEGADIFCEAMLTGIHAWFSDSKASSASSADESWYASLCTTLKLLRHPKSENLLPKSAAIATAAKFRDLVPTVLESQLVETLQEAKEQFSDQVHANTSSQSHARESNFKKLKKAQGKTPFKSPTQKTAKYLLLGSADSGKSTLLKQMRIIYDVPFSHQEIEFWRQLAFENVLHGMGYLLDSLPDLGLSLPATLSSAEQTINNGKHQYMYDDDTFPEQYLGAIAALWNDLTVQTAIRRGGESALPENLSYLCAILPRIFSPSFVPTHHDIFHLRARSTGITETVMSNGIQVVDVGGAKSERRKWIHTFNDVTVIIFTVGLSGYDRCLIEDQDDNQMQDSMAIWDSICHSKWFEGTPIILCLNKNDLFEREVLHSDIVNFFPDFQGDRGDAVAGRNYFINRFSRLANRAGRVLDKDVFIHVVTATDTGMMAELMNSVDTILRTKIKMN